MTKEEYLLFHREFCDRMIEVTRSKNSDYTGLTDDPFANFRLCQAANVASVMQGFLVRMLDKVARINSFAQKGFLEVKTESVTDTLLDLANYSILMAGYIKSETSTEQPHEHVWGDPDTVATIGGEGPNA